MKAKKSLGQNFLHSKKILSDIVRVADIKGGDNVLEVGPGKGALTEILLESAPRLIVVEKDDRLVPVLKEKFKEEIALKKLELVHEDILEFNPRSAALTSGTYSIVANIPYYITGVFLRKFLSGDDQPSRMVLMLQKEVAKRIVANDGKESLLSLSVKAYGRPKYVQTVSKKYFRPAPRVDSAILLIADISKKFFGEDKAKEERFFGVLKAGFAHKRKFLISNLRSLKETAGISWEEKFRRFNISEKARAEDLNLEDWKNLTSDY